MLADIGLTRETLPPTARAAVLLDTVGHKEAGHPDFANCGPKRLPRRLAHKDEAPASEPQRMPKLAVILKALTFAARAVLAAFALPLHRE